MDYIVDPILFYIVSICKSLKTVTGVFGSLFVGGMITAIVCYIYNQYKLDYYKVGNYPSKEDKVEECVRAVRICKRYMFLSILFVLIFISLTIFIPSETTCIEMIIAKNITTETAENGIESLKLAVDYVIDKLQTLQ